MEIYFATHSTSKDNERKIVSGWKDTRLSKKGCRQAKKLGQRLKNKKIDLIFSSDLKRAIQTAKIAFGKKRPINQDKRLREINYGVLTGKPRELIEKLKMSHIKKPFEKGESIQGAILRVIDFLKELKERYSKKRILIIGHRATYYGLEVFIKKKKIKEILKEKFKWRPFWKYKIK